MPVFISYSHQDNDFATQLAAQLVKQKAKVWIDKWELHVGDSLVDRIQEAIQGASALIVVLSRASINSEWCKKELSSGLLRELEERLGNNHLQTLILRAGSFEGPAFVFYKGEYREARRSLIIAS